MSEPERVDLSPLDPEVDRARWTALMDGTRLRVAAALAGRPADTLAVLSEWVRPVLAAAAMLLLLLGATVAAFGGSRAAGVSGARRLAYLSESSILHGHAPSGAQVMSALRVREVR